MDDRDNTRPKHPPLIPQSRDEETTDRIAVSFSVRRALEQVDQRIADEVNKCVERHEYMRKRAHELADDLNAHVLRDAELHTDLTGKSGKNGRLGRLEKMVAGVAAAALLALGAAGKTLLTVGDERGTDRAREQYQEKRIESLERHVEENRAVLIRAGLLLPSFPPRPAASTKPGDVP